MPYSDSASAFLIDLMGTSRTITINGEFVGDKSTLQGAIGNIEAIQNGQQSTVSYAGEIITKNVQIQSFNWDYKEGDPMRIAYTLVMLEGAS
jgi:hypothetical protein